jgi:shikimate kinase
MLSPAEIFAAVERLHAQGTKPFRIVKQIIADAGRARVSLTGTLNDARLTFVTGEEISFDGTEWRFHAREPGEAPDGAA